MSTPLEQLTKPNQCCAPGATNPPLLTILEQLTRGEYKQAGAGTVDHAPKLSETAIKLHDTIKRDLKAYEQITYTTGATLTQRTQLIHTRLANNKYFRKTFEGFEQTLETWATEIQKLLNTTPPKPFKKPCPNCGTLHVHGTTRTALSLHIPNPEPDGTQPQGWLECSQCGWRKTRTELEREYA